MTNLVNFARDPYALLEALQREHGDVFDFALAGQEPVVVCADPEGVRELVTASYETASRYAGGVAVFVDPLSLILLDDEPHRSHRKLLGPNFRVDVVRAFGPTMAEITDKSLDKASLGEAKPLLGLMQDITMRVILRCLLGVDDGPRSEELRILVVEYMKMVFGPEMAAFGALTSPHRARAAIVAMSERAQKRPVDAPFTPSKLPYLRIADRLGRIEAILNAEIAERQAAGVEGRTDVLSKMIAARLADGEALSHRDLLAQLLILIIGGYETTSLTLCWAIHALLRNPEALKAARAEVDEVMGDGFDDSRVRDLKYLNAATYESMRLYPIAVGISRQIRKPMTVAGRELPVGTIVMANIYLTQRHPDLWEDPTVFRPERMMGKRPPPHLFLPFGVGVWRCLGAAFAEHEMRIVLARLLARFDIEAAPGVEIRSEQRSIAAGPSGGLPVILRRRARSATPSAA